MSKGWKEGEDPAWKSLACCKRSVRGDAGEGLGKRGREGLGIFKVAGETVLRMLAEM